MSDLFHGDWCPLSEAYRGPNLACAGGSSEPHYLDEGDFRRGVISTGMYPKCPVWLDKATRCDEPMRELECDGRCDEALAEMRLEAAGLGSLL